mmetsp:Transcript_16521/g.22989  ORF Transcript_16521/g.22989 Transcript_16521/m.22989 type:complete len:385 (-) Transcript_16521:1023-2177(-)
MGCIGDCCPSRRATSLRFFLVYFGLLGLASTVLSAFTCIYFEYEVNDDADTEKFPEYISREGSLGLFKYHNSENGQCRDYDKESGTIYFDAGDDFFSTGRLGIWVAVIAALIAISMAVSEMSCIKMSVKCYSFLASVLFSTACVGQSLTFTAFGKDSICKLQNVECSLSFGSYFSIAGTIAYFLCAVVASILPDRNPCCCRVACLSGRDDYSTHEDGEYGRGDLHIPVGGEGSVGKISVLSPHSYKSNRTQKTMKSAKSYRSSRSQKSRRSTQGGEGGDPQAMNDGLVFVPPAQDEEDLGPPIIEGALSDLSDENDARRKRRQKAKARYSRGRGEYDSDEDRSVADESITVSELLNTTGTVAKATAKGICKVFLPNCGNNVCSK